MKHRIATFASATLLLAGGATFASTVSARDAFSVSIGLPGIAVGYANPGYYAPRVYAPPVAYAPDAVYYGYDAPVAYAPAPVVYGPRVVYSRPYYRPYYGSYYGSYYRPYHHAHYWHR